MNQKISHTEITTEKIGKAWIAKTTITKPLKSEVTMASKTEAIAKEKLRLFLNNEPYKHLDK